MLDQVIKLQDHKHLDYAALQLQEVPAAFCPVNCCLLLLTEEYQLQHHQSEYHDFLVMEISGLMAGKWHHGQTPNQIFLEVKISCLEKLTASSVQIQMAAAAKQHYFPVFL